MEGAGIEKSAVAGYGGKICHLPFCTIYTQIRFGEMIMGRTETLQAESAQTAVDGKEGKYLTFALGSEEYGLEIMKVREIIGFVEVTNVPQTPQHVKGVINLRGQVIPVVELRAKFGMETSEVTEETCIIVMEISNSERTFSTGIVVDQVKEVLDIQREAIEPAPEFGAAVDTDFILGMGKIGNSVKILLDINRVLGDDDFADVA